LMSFFADLIRRNYDRTIEHPWLDLMDESIQYSITVFLILMAGREICRLMMSCLR